MLVSDSIHYIQLCIEAYELKVLGCCAGSQAAAALLRNRLAINFLNLSGSMRRSLQSTLGSIYYGWTENVNNIN